MSAHEEENKMRDMFESFRVVLDKDAALREVSGDIETKCALKEVRALVRELESKGRELLVVLQRTHSHINNSTPDLIEAQAIFDSSVRPLYAQLSALIPPAEYYRYHDQFRFINQRLCFLAAFLAFIREKTLTSRTEVAAQLGIMPASEPDESPAFHLDLEDYLQGLLQLASELSRYAINSVVAGDNDCPFRIAAFLGDLDAKFRLLNLKNDALRKRFDALKYDVQKVEHVVYDLTIRGLKPAETKGEEPPVMASAGRI